MSCHLNLSAATGMPVYFCRRSSPWQRDSNENMNGLLRQYFPKGSDLSVHSVEHLRPGCRRAQSTASQDAATPTSRPVGNYPGSFVGGAEHRAGA